MTLAAGHVRHLIPSIEGKPRERVASSGLIGGVACERARRRADKLGSGKTWRAKHSVWREHTLEDELLPSAHQELTRAGHSIRCDGKEIGQVRRAGGELVGGGNKGGGWMLRLEQLAGGAASGRPPSSHLASAKRVPLRSRALWHLTPTEAAGDYPLTNRRQKLTLFVVSRV